MLLKTALHGKRASWPPCTAIYPNSDVERKIVDVFICKMRKKLASYGIQIETMLGERCFLKEKARIRLYEPCLSG
jgi:hypothetical protein